MHYTRSHYARVFVWNGPIFFFIIVCWILMSWDLKVIKSSEYHIFYSHGGSGVSRERKTLITSLFRLCLSSELYLSLTSIKPILTCYVAINWGKERFMRFTSEQNEVNQTESTRYWTRYVKFLFGTDNHYLFAFRVF